MKSEKMMDQFEYELVKEGVNVNSNNQSLQTTKSKSLRGFLIYSAATEIYSVVSLSLFIPIVLEEMAKSRAKISPAHIISCPTLAFTFVRCKVQLGWGDTWIDPSSYSLFVYAISSILQAFILISISSFADNPVTRQYLMIFFGATGSFFSFCFLFINSSSWQLAGLLAIGANVSLGSSLVVLNSFLKELANNSEAVQKKEEGIQDAQDHLKSLQRQGLVDEDLSQAVLEVSKSQEDLVKERERIISKISSTSIATGYGAGITVLLILLFPVMLMKGRTSSLRLAIGVSGILWGALMIPAAMWLTPQDMPPFNKDTIRKITVGSVVDTSKRVLIDFVYGWGSIYVLLRDWRKLPSTFMYLASWFLLSDAFSTITSTAILFAKTSLNMETSSLILIAALTPAAGVAGAMGFPRLQRDYLNCTNLQTISLLITLALIVPLWAIVALDQNWEMYFLAVYFGAIYGSFVSYSRSCYAELIPAGQAARFYSLYSITDKSSSFLGPALVGIITNATGSIRNGFYLIVLMLLCSIPLLNKVDADQGRKDAENYSNHHLNNVNNGTPTSPGLRTQSPRLNE